MKTKRKETYRNAHDIDTAIRMAQVAWHREKHKMVAAKAEADRCRDILHVVGRENLSDQLRSKFHTLHLKMVEERKLEDASARAMKRLESKLANLKQVSGVIKTETFSFVEDGAVTV